MIASLPMYARPSNRAAHDAFWALIRDGLRARQIAAPDGLDHDIDYQDGWQRPDLVLGHICNLPYRARFRGKVTLIGASDYGLPGCAPGYYNSVLIARRPGKPRDFAERFACNDLLSNSGYGVPQQWAVAKGFTLNAMQITGSHRASIAAVAEGIADMAAIDAQAWRIECAENADTRSLHVIGHTHTTPGMTFITRKDQDPAPYFAAIKTAIHTLTRDDQSALGLRDIIALPKIAYDIPLPPMPQAIRT